VKILELRFYPIKENCFKVSVGSSFGGEADYETSPPFVDGEIPDVSDRRFTVVKILESTEFDVNDFDEIEQAWMLRENLLRTDKSAFSSQYLANIGRKLYEVLGTNIIHVIEAATSDAKRDRTWLHIRLRFPADVPKYVRLTDYPWELLHNDYGFLAHQGVTFSRYIAYCSPQPNLSTVEKLHILLISSGAGDERMGLKPLLSVEKQKIITGLEKAQQQGKIQLEILPSPTSQATWEALQTRLSEHQNTVTPHVLHFDGHGFFGKRCNETRCRKAYKPGATKCECGASLGEAQGYLVFEKADGTADFISARELGELLGNSQRREQPNSEQGIVLVVLSACKSGMSLLSESVFNGVGQNLISQGIPAVVAMSYSITVDAASAFSECFYRSLGEKEALTVALRSGQRQMGIEGNQWYRPVLYLRWEDNEGGQLFNLSPIEDERVNLKAAANNNNNGNNQNVFTNEALPNSRRDFYSKQLAQKHQELAAIESQLMGTLSAVDELKLNNQAEVIMQKIEELNAKLSQ
jgi:CHAT domain/Effector-associated domain 9